MDAQCCICLNGGPSDDRLEAAQRRLVSEDAQHIGGMPRDAWDESALREVPCQCSTPAAPQHVHVVCLYRWVIQNTANARSAAVKCPRGCGAMLNVATSRAASASGTQETYTSVQARLFPAPSIEISFPQLGFGLSKNFFQNRLPLFCLLIGSIYATLRTPSCLWQPPEQWLSLDGFIGWPLRTGLLLFGLLFTVVAFDAATRMFSTDGVRTAYQLLSSLLREQMSDLETNRRHDVDEILTAVMSVVIMMQHRVFLCVVVIGSTLFSGDTAASPAVFFSFGGAYALVRALVFAFVGTTCWCIFVSRLPFILMPIMIVQKLVPRTLSVAVTWKSSPPPPSPRAQRRAQSPSRRRRSVFKTHM
jgi:hypothetical protein